MAPTSSISSRPQSRSPSVSGKASPIRPATHQHQPGIIRLPHNINNHQSPRAVARNSPRNRRNKVQRGAENEGEDEESSMTQEDSEDVPRASGTSSPSKRNNRRKRNVSSALDSTAGDGQSSSSTVAQSQSQPQPRTKTSPRSSDKANDKGTPSTDAPSPSKSSRRRSGKNRQTQSPPPSSLEDPLVPEDSGVSVVDLAQLQISPDNLSRSAPSGHSSSSTANVKPNAGRGRQRSAQHQQQQQAAHPNPPAPAPTSTSTTTSTSSVQIPRPRSVPLEQALQWPSEEAAYAVHSAGSSPQKNNPLTWQQEMMRSSASPVGSPQKQRNGNGSGARPRAGRSQSGLVPPALPLGSGDEMFTMDDVMNASPPPETQMDPRSSLGVSPFSGGYGQQQQYGYGQSQGGYGHSQPGSPIRSNSGSHRRNVSYGYAGQHVFNAAVGGGQGGMRFAAPSWKNSPDVSGLRAPAFLSGQGESEKEEGRVRA